MKTETQPVVFFLLDGFIAGLFVDPSTLEDWDPPDVMDLQPILKGKIEYEPNNEGLRTLDIDDGLFAFSDRGRLSITAFDKGHLVYVVEKLLHDRILERERLADHEYVWSRIRANVLSIFEEMGVIGDPTPEFVSFARTAIENGKREIAILLIATAVEQELNVFYRHALTARNLIENLLTEDEICEIIKSNLPPKTSWLLALLAGSRLPEEIRRQIINVSELRNQIVHFKAVPSEHYFDELKGSHNLLRQRLEAIDYDRLLQLPTELSQELDKILELVRATNLPDYSIAKNTVDALVESIRNGKMTLGTFVMNQVSGQSIRIHLHNMASNVPLPLAAHPPTCPARPVRFSKPHGSFCTSKSKITRRFPASIPIVLPTGMPSNPSTNATMGTTEILCDKTQPQCLTLPAAQAHIPGRAYAPS